MFLEMNIRIQPSFPPFKDEFDDTMKKDLKELDKIFGKFVKSKTKSEIMYTVTEYDKIYPESKEVLLHFSENLDIQIYEYLIYEEDDFDEAVAFDVVFDCDCEFKETLNYDPYERICETLAIDMLKEDALIKQNQKIKQFPVRYMGANGPQYEKIISPLLKEYLVKNNVSEQYFRPVYSKRTSKDVFAYQVTGKGSVLPPLSYMPSLDNYLLECKFHHLYEIYEKSDSRGVYENTKYENIISYAAAKQRRYITKEAYDLLDDINEVYETIERNRVILFNRRTFQLLLDRVPNIKKYSIPVFLLEKVPKNVWEKR